MYQALCQANAYGLLEDKAIRPLSCTFYDALTA